MVQETRCDTAKSNNDQPSLSSTQRAVASLWSEVLQMAQLPALDEDFFSLGGDSMTMVMAEFRIVEELSVQLPQGATLSARTIRELAAVIDELGAACDIDENRAASSNCPGKPMSGGTETAEDVPP